jgi:hypothetical protein
LTLPEEHRLRVFENKLLGIIFETKRDVIGGCGELDNEELRNLYTSAIIIIMVTSRRMICAGNIARMGRR